MDNYPRNNPPWTYDDSQPWIPFFYQSPYDARADGTPVPGIMYYRPHPPRQPEQSRPAPVLEDGATKVVCLAQMISADAEDLRDDELYEDLVDEVEDEAWKFGHLMSVVIPRPGHAPAAAAGVGRVFLEYADLEGSDRCKTKLHWRWFGGRRIVAAFYPKDKFAGGDYDVPVDENSAP
ncbi:splicing factor U2af large subunit B [Brachypodium distachyon]|nr:splicing factor U2af large subunit B [Brachypodium distachyon]|eukprot:XP_003576839.1 splicing factor U2af large subunit B [Brachypodium distachyon]